MKSKFLVSLKTLRRSEIKIITKEKKGIIVTVEKNVYNLYPTTSTLEKTIETLNKMCKGLRQNIYTSHRQWNAHEQARKTLTKDTFITIGDYQMNMTVEYSENPTSMAYSTNKHSVALYLIGVEYIDDQDQLAKGAITFLSDDTNHCNQQVQNFEKRAVEIIKEKLNRSFNHWIRYTDGCSGQFKSGYCIADLFEVSDQLNIPNAEI